LFTTNEIHPIKDGTHILSAVDLDIDNENIKKICLINLYYPPRSFEGIQQLSDWFNQHNDCRIPTFIFMDSNLHHSSWNPFNYKHTHQQSRDLIRNCGCNGFKIISEKGVPTFIKIRTSPIVIDLTWGNLLALKYVHSCCTSLSNFGSDHQAIILQLNFNPHSIPKTRLSVDLKHLDIEKLCVDLSKCFVRINC
jgi:hypothetical protein